tara:strand:- start:4 stop:195 length:192 start_codon:yes stop_codon:yes gene_type:complete
VIDAIIKDFRAEQERLKDVLASGRVDDHMQYRYVVGSISSLEWAILRIKEIESRLMQEDEEEL